MPADNVQDYMRCTVAMAQRADPDSARRQAEVAAKMMAAQLAGAGRLAREWKPKKWIRRGRARLAGGVDIGSHSRI